MPEKPIKVTENPFGDFSEEQLQGEPLADRFFLGGYSDQKHERELDIKAGKKPRVLPRRFQFVSVQNRDGTLTGDKELEFRRKGYKVVMYDEAVALGIDLANSSAVKGPDGTVRVGSQKLMAIDAPGAARNFKQQREDTEQQFDRHVRGPLEQAADKYNAKHGRDERTGTHFTLEETIE